MADTERSIIPGLHFFCDHRCWRCSLAHRCQVPLHMAETPQLPVPRRAGGAGRVAAVVMASLYVTVEQVGAMLGTPIQPLPPSAPRPEPPPRNDDLPDEAESDPMVMKAKEYASGALRVLQTLRPRLHRLADARMLDAAERLEETCLTIASKTHRAVSSALEPDSDPSEPQGDSSGSAKVALLLIEESRQAWRELMQPGRSMGNGAPSRFVRNLDALERLLHERFPRALEFIRPGFDTADDGVKAQVARALLTNSQTTRN